MCGIVGYIGPKQASRVLMEGLERLSYRGYDSAGIAVIDSNGKLCIRKAKGKLDQLAHLLEKMPLQGCAGIGHTRWATHGEPSDINAHPHTDVKGGIAVVHNGIIENHISLRRHLQSFGAQFVSQTDTEVIAHLLHQLYNGDMRQTLMKAMSMLEGSYALAVICDQQPESIFCARNDSPLVIGFREGAAFLASDIPALLSHTRDVVFLQDKEIAVLDRNGVHVYDTYGKSRPQAVFHVDWDLASAEKGGYAHYMLKEIHEQPSAVQKTLSSRCIQGKYDWLPLSPKECVSLSKITFAACGTAYHAALIGKYAIEKLARIPVEVDIASEYRYRSPLAGENECFIAVSQSGETADTLAAVREAKRIGVRCLAICNSVGSSIMREVGEDNTLLTYAGPEIAVASTKAYITQTALIITMAIAIADLRGMLSQEKRELLFAELTALSKKMEDALLKENQMQKIASTLCQKKHAFFVGRGMDYALSMEAALKLKEVSYIFSEAYASGELKHGPIALIEPGRLVVAVLTQEALLEKSLNNLQEASARGASILAVCCERFKNRLEGTAACVVAVPDADDLIAPLLAAIPLQLFAYCMAVERGCDVDRPRNLAKSVTVE